MAAERIEASEGVGDQLVVRRVQPDYPTDGCTSKPVWNYVVILAPTAFPGYIPDANMVPFNTWSCSLALYII